MPGGLSEVKLSSPDVESLVLGLKPQIEEKFGRSVEELSVHSYKTQVVAGTNYFVKAKVSSAEYVHLRIYKHFGGEVSLHSIQTEKMEGDEINHF